MMDNSKLMFGWVRTGAVLTLVLVGVFATAGRMALAQSGTATPDIPPAGDCTVPALDISALISSAGQADPNSPLFTAEAVPESSLPDGPAASDDELAGITATTRQLVACANAQDPFRILALISPKLIGELGSAALAAQQRPELAEQLLTRFPVPLAGVASGERIPMIGIRDARLLPDGSVGAILESDVPGSHQHLVFFATFVKSDHRWLVDAVQPVQSGSFATPAATPAA